jgi:hypothetical protein
VQDFSDAVPGADLVRAGLNDLANGIESSESLLALIGAPRLRSLGFDVPHTPDYAENAGFL